MDGELSEFIVRQGIFKNYKKSKVIKHRKKEQDEEAKIKYISYHIFKKNIQA